MNWKSTWALLVTAGLVFAFIVFVEQPLRRAREQQASRRVLPGLDPALVTNIEIHPWGQAIIQAVRQNSAGHPWRLARPLSYPAQNQRFAVLLDSLAKLEWVDRISEKELTGRPDAQEEFGFTKPRVTLLLQGGGADRRVEIGEVGAFGDRVSLQVVGNTAIFEVDAELMELLPTNQNEWRDPALLNLANLAYQTLRVRVGGKDFDLERDATHHLWFMRKPLSARADTAKIDELLERLQTTLVAAFTNDDPQAELDAYGTPGATPAPELSLTFLDHTNIVAGLQVGGSVTNATNFVFVKRVVPGNIVVVSQDALKPWLAPHTSFTNFLDQHFISLSPALVESISVRGEDAFVVKKQANGKWLVSAGGKTFAPDETLMENWLGNMTNVPTEIAETVVTDFAPYGLTNPALEYIVGFRPQAGAHSEARIEFGTNKSGRVFERRLGEDFVNTVGREYYEALPQVSWQLRDRQIWHFESSNVVNLTIHQLGGTLKYMRDPEGKWTYAPGFNSQVPFNTFAIEETVVRIGNLHAVYWDAVGDKDLDRFGFAKADYALEFEVSRGATHVILRIQFGTRSPYLHPYACVVKDGERLTFEFPADLYQLVDANLTLYTARLDRR